MPIVRIQGCRGTRKNTVAMLLQDAIGKREIATQELRDIILFEEGKQPTQEQIDSAMKSKFITLIIVESPQEAAV